MNPTCNSAWPSWLRWISALTLLAAAAMSGCGGSVGVGGTGSYASGPIEGFGSIFVGGIEFDDASASVVDDEGRAGTRDALRLGMFAEVDSGEFGGSADAPTAVATRIRIVSELVGLAGDIDLVGGTLVVFGQTVQLTEITVFDTAFANGLASVADGTAVEVFGFYDAAANRFNATRIAPKHGTLAAFKVRGPVQDLNPDTKTFRIGEALFSYGGTQPLLADGAYLRVVAETLPVGGRWVVRSVSEGVRLLPDLDRVKLRGTITRYVSDMEFSVNGQPVDARTAEFIGRPGDLVLGRAVVVDGRSEAGVLVAEKVRLDDNGGAQGNFTLQGAIESADAAAQTFVLRGVTVFHGANGVQFEGGTAADLQPGRALTVRGALSASGTQLTARRVSFD